MAPHLRRLSGFRLLDGAFVPLPLREKRKKFENDKGLVEQIIYQGTQKMIEVSNVTIKEMRSAMGLGGAWNKISRMARERMESKSPSQFVLLYNSPLFVFSAIENIPINEWD